LVEFRYEVWLLPLRPGPVFRLHRIGRKMEVENSIFVSREFQNEQSLRCAKIEIDVASAHRGVFGGTTSKVSQEIATGVTRTITNYHDRDGKITSVAFERQRTVLKKSSCPRRAAGWR
jgi:hypothetical protein